MAVERARGAMAASHGRSGSKEEVPLGRIPYMGDSSKALDFQGWVTSGSESRVLQNLRSMSTRGLRTLGIDDKREIAKRASSHYPLYFPRGLAGAPRNKDNMEVRATLRQRDACGQQRLSARAAQRQLVA